MIPVSILFDPYVSLKVAAFHKFKKLDLRENI